MTKFILSRLAAIPITFLIVTATLYAIVMLASPEERAGLYWPPRTRQDLPAETAQRLLERIIADHGLRDPYPIQYVRWLANLLQGDWGYSPALNDDVLRALLRRTPVTLELTLYSALTYIPIGLSSGLLAGWRYHSRIDHGFRLLAFFATAIAPFILALVLLSVFYVGLGWFPPGRTSFLEVRLERDPTFQGITGLLTIDGLLRGRPDITLDALRHLVLPVFSLSLVHWATLARVTRAHIIDEKEQEYILAARARGLHPRHIMLRHAFPNVVPSALTSSALSASQLIMGVFIIEQIFDLGGVSALITRSIFNAPDAALVMGFAVYSILLVIPLMVVLDILKVLADPRIAKGLLK